MIHLNIMGGMGNQMFQYAFARSLSEKCDDKDIIIDPYFLTLIRMSALRKALKTANSLIHFKLNNNVMLYRKGGYKTISSYIAYVYNTFCVHITPELFEKRSRKGIYLQTAKDSWMPVAKYSTDSGKKIVTGYFGGEKWWASDIGGILRDEFRIKEAPSKSNKKMIDRISSCNSVCVHIRRGDYLIPQNSYLNICDERYYRAGMDYIAQRTQDPEFFIFSNNSDDVRWIRQNYKFDYPVNYVDLNNPDYEELRLMYHCKHFVTCNSTFSWWGSYLSKNRDKIVVAPDKWNSLQNNTMSESIYRDDMIRLHVN